MTVALVFLALVLLPALAGFLCEPPFCRRNLLKPAFDIGAPVVYRQQEISTNPASDARDVRPSARGEFYYYSIINYLRVIEVLDDDRIIAVARDNKRVCFWPNDSSLRKAGVIERFIYRFRFPHT